jgi:hypothetical protein
LFDVRFSNFLRDLHKYLVEEYGVSTWGSYALFGVSTIVVGALLGLLLVCVMDYINPPKPIDSMFPPEASGAGGDASRSAHDRQDAGEDTEDSGSRDDDDDDDEGEEGGTSQEDDDEDGEEGSEDEEEEEGDEAEPTQVANEREAASGDQQPRRRPRRAD